MTFSIIIPVYNVAPYLRECLDSVLAQTYTDWEAICVDDGSTDGSGSILDEYAAKDSRFKVTHQTNGGVSAARNTALDMVNGEWISFLDSDDVLAPFFLCRVIKVLKVDSNVDIVGFRYVNFCNSVEFSRAANIDASFVDTSKELPSQVVETSRVLIWTNVFRTSILRNMRFENVICGEDRIFAFDCFAASSKVAIISDVLYGYRERSTSYTSAKAKTFSGFSSEIEYRLKLLRRVRTMRKKVAFTDGDWFIGYLGSCLMQEVMNAKSLTYSEKKALWRQWRKGASELCRCAYFSIIQRAIFFMQRFVVHYKIAAMFYKVFDPDFYIRRFYRYVRSSGEFNKQNSEQSGIKKTVCFILPGPCVAPIGGYKIVYEYANRLSEIGWKVFLTYPLIVTSSNVFRSIIRHPRSMLIQLWNSIILMMRQKRAKCSWFHLNDRVSFVFPLQMSDRWARKFPVATKFIATYITTVDVLNDLHVPTSDKFSFVQGYETWCSSEEYVARTYRYCMKKIAIAEWLVDKIREAGGFASYVPNGLDFNKFYLTVPIKKRSPTEIAMLWHKEAHKRTEDAVSALAIVREDYKQLHVTAFGVHDPPCNLPPWITYVKQPDNNTHRQIYNNAAIYVSASETEGMALTPCEAMQCGAAFVGTDIGGFKTVAIDGKTALLSPVRNPEALARNICRLIEDDELRIRIAEAGHEYVKQFTWDKAVEKFEKCLTAE